MQGLATSIRSKPTQHSVQVSFRRWALSPNIIVLRCDEPLEPEIFKKIAMFCNVKPDCVIENMTLPCLYEAPLMLEKSELLPHRLPRARPVDKQRLS